MAPAETEQLQAAAAPQGTAAPAPSGSRQWSNSVFASHAGADLYSHNTHPDGYPFRKRLGDLFCLPKTGNKNYTCFW